MTHHTELLNLIAKTINASTYVEIGVCNPAHNFDHINVENKFGIDPDPKAGANCRMTSDQFFEFMKRSGAMVDLTWIDGLHYDDQVRRDIENAWQVLRIGGVMAIHDCNPPTKQTTCIPRGSQREWCGTVYPAIANLACFSKFTVDFDYGCCVVRKEPGHSLIIRDVEYTWEQFNDARERLLDLISIDEAIQRISSWI